MRASCVLLCVLMSCSSSKSPGDPPSTSAASASAAEKISFSDDRREYDLEGVPLVGGIHYDVNLSAPDKDLARASGKVTFRCDACTVGDGVAKYKLPGADSKSPARIDSFASEGLTIPTIRLGSMRGEIIFERGRGAVTLTVDGQADLRLTATGTLTLASELKESRLDLEWDIVLGDGLDEPFRNVFVLMSGGSAAGPSRLHMTGTVGQPRLRPERSRPAPPAGSAQPIASSPGVASPAPAPASAPAIDMDAKDLPKHVARGKGGVVSISGEAADWVMQNPAVVARGARVVPAIKDGKGIGFKLLSIGAGSIFALLGLESGDIVTAVNGFELASPDRALEAYVALRGATDFRIEIIREGRPLTLAFEIRR